MTTVTTESFDTWLHRPWPAGVLAVGGCDANDVSFFHALGADGTPRLPDTFWQTLNEALAQLAAHGCAESESLWRFETALLWIARRADGAWAGVITVCELPESTLIEIDASLSEFARMTC